MLPLNHLESITFINVNTDDSLSMIEKCNNIKEISVLYTQSLQNKISSFIKNEYAKTSLVYLHLLNTDFDDDCVRHILKYNQLKVFWVTGKGISKDSENIFHKLSAHMSVKISSYDNKGNEEYRFSGGDEHWMRYYDIGQSEN